MVFSTLILESTHRGGEMWVEAPLLHLLFQKEGLSTSPGAASILGPTKIQPLPPRVASERVVELFQGLPGPFQAAGSQCVLVTHFVSVSHLM